MKLHILKLDTPLLRAALLGLAALMVLTPRAEAKILLGLVLAEKQNDTLDEQVVNETTQAFLSSKRFTLAEREQLETVFSEKGLKGFIGDEEGSHLEDTLGLEMVGLVSYVWSKTRDRSGDVDTTYNITVRLIDVATGEVFGTVDSKRPGLPLAGSLRGAGDDLLANLRKLFPPEGYIIQLSGEEAVVDLGATLGLRKGDTLEVIEQDPPVLHPVTGRELPGPERVVAVLKVRRVDTEISTCRVKTTESELSVGHRVRFKDKTSILPKIFRRFR